MENQNIKQDLALAYRITSHLNMDDHTYTHISMRPIGTQYFYMAPFGLSFGEVTANDLIKLNTSI